MVLFQEINVSMESIQNDRSMDMIVTLMAMDVMAKVMEEIYEGQKLAFVMGYRRLAQFEEWNMNTEKWKDYELIFLFTFPPDEMECVPLSRAKKYIKFEKKWLKENDRRN